MNELPAVKLDLWPGGDAIRARAEGQARGRRRRTAVVMQAMGRVCGFVFFRGEAVWLRSEGTEERWRTLAAALLRTLRQWVREGGRF